MERTVKPGAAGILLLLMGVGIPVLLILAVALAFSRGSVSPGAEGSDFLVVLFGSIVFFLALWILPIIGGGRALRRQRWNLCRWAAILSLVYIPLVTPVFTMLAVNTTASRASTVVYYIVAAVPLLAIPALVLIVQSRGEFELPGRHTGWRGA